MFRVNQLKSNDFASAETWNLVEVNLTAPSLKYCSRGSPENLTAWLVPLWFLLTSSLHQSRSPPQTPPPLLTGCLTRRTERTSYGRAPDSESPGSRASQHEEWCAQVLRSSQLTTIYVMFPLRLVRYYDTLSVFCKVIFVSMWSSL